VREKKIEWTYKKLTSRTKIAKMHVLIIILLVSLEGFQNIAIFIFAAVHLLRKQS